jgi:hypothetical protein
MSFLYTINKTIMRWVKGKTVVRKYPRTASVTFTKGNLVMFTSGLIATATSQSTKHVGIILVDVASTDSDFATAAVKVPVEVPLEPGAEFEADVSAGTLATTSIGAAFDLVDASNVTQAGTTYQVVTCKGFISASKGRFSLNSNLDFADTTWD